MSRPTRAAWIETVATSDESEENILSRPTRAAWIETAVLRELALEAASRGPPGPRGLKPERRMRPECLHMSRPTRAAWIETPQAPYNWYGKASRPTRAAWIETGLVPPRRGGKKGRGPPGPRGLKLIFFFVEAGRDSVAAHPGRVD